MRLVADESSHAELAAGLDDWESGASSALAAVASVVRTRRDLRAGRQQARLAAGTQGWHVHCLLLLVVAAVVPASVRLGPLHVDAAFYVALFVFGGALVLTATLPPAAWSGLSCYGVFLFVTLLSVLWTINFYVALRTLAQLAAPAIVYLLSWRLPDRERFLRAASVVAIVGLLVGSLVLLLPVADRVGVAGRALTIGLIPLFVLASHGLPSRRSVLALGSLALMASIVSGARACSGLILLVLVTTPALRLRWPARVAVIIVGTALVVLASHTAAFKERFFFSHKGTLSDVLSLGNSPNINTSGRRDVWPRIEQVCAARRITGFGVGSSFSISAEASNGALSQPHSEYLRLQCDTGYVGSVPAWAFFGLALLRCGWWAYRDPRARQLHLDAAQLIVVLFILAATDNPLVYAGVFMAPLALSLGLSDATVSRGRWAFASPTATPRRQRVPA